MRLRTFESFWLVKNGILHSYPSLQHNEQADIVVVGSGISGALVSHALVEKGYDVLVIDKRDVGMGSTAATTSMLQYELDVPLIKLSGMIGEEDAALCYKAGITAIDNMERLVKTHGLDCGFVRKESLYVAHNAKAAKWLYEEYEMRNKHGLGVQWLTENEIRERYGMVTCGGILSAAGASADMYKMTHELIQLNVQRGMRVYDQTEIKEFYLDTEAPTILLENGCRIKCKKVVFCTGFEATAMLKEKIADLFYTYACVSEQHMKFPRAINGLLIWDTESPYLYMRTTDDGRLLVGGEDSNNNNGWLQQKIQKRKAIKLARKIQEKFPGVSFIEDFSWGGTFGATKDGLPYIGPSPEYKNAFFVLGFGGNGATFAVQAMDIIPDMLEGKVNRLGELYGFGR